MLGLTCTLSKMHNIFPREIDRHRLRPSVLENIRAMPIKLRCYCGYILTLKSALAGKKIRCTQCDEVLTVPVPEQVKARRKKAGPKKRHPPQRDPWDVDDFGSQPSYEQPQYFLPGPAGPTVTPRQRKKTSRQTDQQVTKYVGIALVVVFFGGAVLLGMFAMKNRVKLDTPENERARVLREVGQGKVVGRIYTNDYFKLKVTIPEPYNILDKQMTSTMETLLSQDSSRHLTPAQKSVAAREKLILAAVNNWENELEEPNAGIFIFVTRIGNVPGIQTPMDYLEATRKNIIPRRLAGTTAEPARDGFSLGSLKAASMKITIRENGTTSYEKIYTARVRDYHLTLLIFYEIESDRRALERIIDSVQASE